MAKRTKNLTIDKSTMSITQKMQKGKVLVIVLDGEKEKATITEAVEHGMTVIETVNGKSVRIHYDEKELI